MSSRILKVVLVVAATASSSAMAQQPVVQQSMEPHRTGSWEFSLGGGALFQDGDLRDFLGSGPAETRFADTDAPGAGTPTIVARVGHNFTNHVGLSASIGGAKGAGVTYINPTAAVTYTMNLDARTSPFLLLGTELTRISGGNDRVTHSTWGLHAGAGVRQMVSDRVALRLEGRMQFAGYDEVPMASDRTSSPVVTLGFSYFTRGRAPRQAWTAARVDTLHTMRVDTVQTVRADTVRLADLSADQVVLRVQFETDRAELLPISRPVLNTVAAAIIATPGSRWQVEGHTDSVGSADDNKLLSQQRAQSVADYLVSRGVSRGVMTAVGFGPDRPVFSNTTAEGRAQNRRVQLRRIPAAPTETVR